MNQAPQQTFSSLTPSSSPFWSTAQETANGSCWFPLSGKQQQQRLQSPGKASGEGEERITPNTSAGHRTGITVLPNATEVTCKGSSKKHPQNSLVVALTHLEASHVVDLGAESQRGQNMDQWENDPKPHIVFPKHLKAKTYWGRKKRKKEKPWALLPAVCSFPFLYHHRALDNPTEYERETPIILQVKTKSIILNRDQENKRSLALLENKPLLLNAPSDQSDDLEGRQLAQGAETQSQASSPCRARQQPLWPGEKFHKGSQGTNHRFSKCTVANQKVQSVPITSFLFT